MLITVLEDKSLDHFTILRSGYVSRSRTVVNENYKNLQ